jgi:hypothetical protein
MAVDRSSSPGRCKIFSSSRRPDRLWDPPSLLCSRYRGIFTREKKRPECEANHTFNQHRGQKYVDLYIQSHTSYVFIMSDYIGPSDWVISERLIASDSGGMRSWPALRPFSQHVPGDNKETHEQFSVRICSLLANILV